MSTMADEDFKDTQDAQAHLPALPADSPARETHGTRRKLLTGIAAAVLASGLGYGGWYVLVGSHEVETENAYVGADTAQVTPMVAGQVVDVLKADTQPVKRGDI